MRAKGTLATLAVLVSVFRPKRLRGHPIHWDGECFRYDDNGEPTATTWRERPCGKCGLYTPPNGHDPCIANLPGVHNACCGHGETREAYVVFTDGRRIAGKKAIKWQKQQASCPIVDDPYAPADQADREALLAWWAKNSSGRNVK